MSEYMFSDTVNELIDSLNNLAGAIKGQEWYDTLLEKWYTCSRRSFAFFPDDDVRVSFLSADEHDEHEPRPRPIRQAVHLIASRASLLQPRRMPVQRATPRLPLTQALRP
jgi:hypothetical protein